MLDKISIGIKTFLRDEKLFNTINAIHRRMPEAEMIIVDCGEMTPTKEIVYDGLRALDHKVIELPFDAGFGAMSNAIVSQLTRPFLLIGSDDFNFDENDVRSGIEQLWHVLDRGFDIASGRVNNNPYEFNLEITPVTKTTRKIKEIPVRIPERVIYQSADLTVNYSLIRKTALDKVGWDSGVKIGGGEHGAFFYDAKMAGLKVVYVPGVNINEQSGQDSEHYKSFRSRASKSPERPCFDKRGIIEYILGTGEVDYRKEQ